MSGMPINFKALLDGEPVFGKAAPEEPAVGGSTSAEPRASRTGRSAPESAGVPQGASAPAAPQNQDRSTPRDTPKRSPPSPERDPAPDHGSSADSLASSDEDEEAALRKRVAESCKGKIIPVDDILGAETKALPRAGTGTAPRARVRTDARAAARTALGSPFTHTPRPTCPSSSDEDEAEVPMPMADAAGNMPYPRLGRSAKTFGPNTPLVLPGAAAAPDGNAGAVGVVPGHVRQYLRKYQVEGLEFLWAAYTADQGAVLADDMGLGKTVQAIALLIAAFGDPAVAGGARADAPAPKAGPGGADLEPARLALIFAPKTVLHNWRREVETWCGLRVAVAHGTHKPQAVADAADGRVDVLLCSIDQLRKAQDLEPLTRANKVSMVFFDEAHKLKTRTAGRTLGAHEACTNVRRRFLLTGTPMSNDAGELWSMLDLASRSQVGGKEDFKQYYSKPISDARLKDATRAKRDLGEGRMGELQGLLAKWLLRRLKSEVIPQELPEKSEKVVLVAMGDTQLEACKRVLADKDVAALRGLKAQCPCGSGATFAECCTVSADPGPLWRAHHPDGNTCERCPQCLILPMLAKLLAIANHLDLVRVDPEEKRRDKEAYERNKAFALAALGEGDQGEDGVPHWQRSRRLDDMADVRSCGKLNALGVLLDDWKEDPDNRALVFSYSVRVLDIIGIFLERRGTSYLRLDGSVTSPIDRAARVDEFNSPLSTKKVFLISTRAGGEGLNLVAANRVVIFDPNWNPSHDQQAQDRAFRIGQRRDVEVFRLVSAGSIEERIYQRQLFKGSLADAVLAGKTDAGRMFQAEDVKGLDSLLAPPPPTKRLAEEELLARYLEEKGARKLRDGVVVAPVPRPAPGAVGQEGAEEGEERSPGKRRERSALEEEHGMAGLAAEIEAEYTAENSARQRKRARTEAGLMDAGGMIVDHGRLTGKAAPPVARPVAGKQPAEATEAQMAGAIAQPPGEVPTAAASPAAPEPRRLSPLKMALNLLEREKEGTSRLPRKAFLELLRTNRGVAWAVARFMDASERDALAAHLNDGAGPSGL